MTDSEVTEDAWRTALIAAIAAAGLFVFVGLYYATGEVKALCQEIRSLRQNVERAWPEGR